MNCAKCGHLIEHDDARFCPNCASPLERVAAPEPDPNPAREEPEVQPNSVPFEDASTPFFERYWQTLVLSFTDPKKLFSNMQQEDLTAPTIYAVITGSVSGVFALMWQFLFGGLATLAEDTGVEALAFTGVFSGVMLVLLPFMVALSLFIWSGIYHLCLLLVGTQSRGFGITLRAVAYGYGPNLLAIIPLCGGIIGGLWTAVLAILGTFYGHRTDAWRAIVAYFIPTVFCCLVVIVLWFMIAGIAISQQGL